MCEIENECNIMIILLHSFSLFCKEFQGFEEVNDILIELNVSYF